MNLAQQFSALNPPTRREIAKIIGDRGGGVYSAQTSANIPLILYGQAQVGENVWYDAHSQKILEPAPKIDFIDLPI